MSHKRRENELGNKFYGVQKGSKPVHRYSTSQLIAGKWKLTVSPVSLEIFDFLDICLLSSPPFLYVFCSKFDWVPG